MTPRRTTFALFFGNRGFFPETLIAGAREEMRRAVESAGFGALLADEDLTRYGAVETPEEGRRYAAFLAAHRGAYDGVVLCLPNFGDETGAVAALQDCGVPILVQAYPDAFGRMGFADRRDAFCGKLAVLDVFSQYRLPFTAFESHAVHPASPAFREQLARFDAVCRVVRGMRRFTVAAVGARTTAFKTVRYDELALQRKGVTVETSDLSDLLARVRSLDAASAEVAARRAALAAYADFSAVPAAKADTIARLSLALDATLRDLGADALALRCWDELEKELGVAPCVLLGALNDRGVPAACELDVCNAVAMRALSLAADAPSTLLDWNNNYGDDPDKCILFHCGPVPESLMAGKGTIAEHLMFAKAYGAGCGWGCDVGRIGAFPMTFASAKTEDGRLSFYLGEGEMTADPIEEGFFGCAGVARVERLQRRLLGIGRNGFRHHVAVARGAHEAALREAFAQYLGYDIVEV